MNRIISILPELEMDEALFLDTLLKDKTDDQVRNYLMVYRSRRRDPQIILITTLVGLFGLAGIQRFITNQIGMGVLYFLTGGLCLIGTIIDLVNYKTLAMEYNQRVAREVMMFI